MSLFHRLGKVMSSRINHWLTEKNNSKNNNNSNFKKDDFSNSYHTHHSESSHNSSKTKPLKQLEQDLNLFDLKPPSSLEEVKRQRNQILKKYHPDRFNNDEEKLKVAKELIQEYNNAFARLEQHFKK